MTSLSNLFKYFIQKCVILDKNRHLNTNEIFHRIPQIIAKRQWVIWVLLTFYQGVSSTHV